MKITSFNPLVSVSIGEVENTVKLFEDMGFVVKHHPVIEEEEFGRLEWVVMENESGFRMDIGGLTRNAKPDKAITSIRINVDDFDEGVEFLTSRGFKLVPGQSKPVETASLKSALYMSSTGFLIALVYHKKDRK